MDFERELDICIRARFTLLVLSTFEEERAETAIASVCEKRGRPALTWDVADGFRTLTGWKGSLPLSPDPYSALAAVEQEGADAVFVLRDFHDCWADPRTKRKLRSVTQKLKFTKKSIIVITPKSRVPEELKDVAVVLDFPPPGEGDLEQTLQMLLSTPGVTTNLDDKDREKLLRAAQGLSTSHALRVFAKAIVSNGVLDENDVHVVTDEKKEFIRESEALDFYIATESLSDVGGLEAIKDWLRLRERALTNEAREYGLPAPKGIALIGIPGTGKSLTAKMVGSLWRLPLIRLDVGTLFGSYIGESEERARRALRVAESIAPCVMWIDEMEKALAHGGHDSGTSTRVFGTILTWMQEKTAPCFVVATANNISMLPPELLRRGRFDEIFFLDLPTKTERRAIFEVHLRKRGRDVSCFDVEKLADASDGYVGAEIEQAIIDAMYVGFDQGREFTTDDILRSIEKQVPMSVSQRENVYLLRQWLMEGRARSASYPEIEQEEEAVSLEREEVPPDEEEVSATEEEEEGTVTEEEDELILLDEKE